jgi:hypothetical protein
MITHMHQLPSQFNPKHPTTDLVDNLNLLAYFLFAL